MKLKFLLIGTMLVLMLCISPVVAVSGSDFDIDIDNFNDDGHDTYKYYNKNIQYEKYIHIHTSGTSWLCSLVTFKPANIPDAPVMVVDTSYYEKEILLTNSVDEWEIKYYSAFGKRLKNPDEKYLKNKGVFNLNELFGEYISKGSWLELQLSRGQYIWCPDAIPYGPEIDIPEVDRGD
jgi:hypothetical protein